mmetsp:Transcript_26960/g.40502  ORF Transcript_26960/g.40502 Transcript_26960/m.40502 type:complete len:510 (+) Transcript_26960:218-1747(+)
MSGVLGLIKSSLPDWPDWAINLLLVMTLCLGVTYAISSFFSSDDDNDDDDDKTESTSSHSNGSTSTSTLTSTDTTTTNTTTTTSTTNQDQLKRKFDKFRTKYIIVYLIIMLADWMQGTHMYTLYLSYNVNISALFLTGFLSGAIFAPFLGSAVDKFGRKTSCIAYCILEIIINILEHYHDFTTLLIGRVLGGISTNLLFSAFESWMTTQHRINGFPEVWLEKTYAAASIGNGTMAIAAGIVAQLLEDKLGHIGPFQGAVALTFIALLLILTWEENYGEVKKGGGGDDSSSSSSSLYAQFTEGWRATCTDSNIWRIGLTQALSEGAMYTFVFMWVPTLLSMDPPGGVPTGCVFSSLMIAITMGGLFFPVMHSFVSKTIIAKDRSSEMTAALTYALASCSMAVPAACLSGVATAEICFEKVLISFVVVEFSVGLFNPVAGTLRSKYVPDHLQGGILNIFRLPLNAVVVAGTHATDVFPPHVVFMLVSGCFMAAALIQSTMIVSSSGKAKKD